LGCASTTRQSSASQSLSRITQLTWFFGGGGAAATDPRDGRSGDPDAEQIGHQFGQAIFRQQLIVQQIGHDGGNPRAILHGRVDAEGKPSAAVRAAGGAAAVMGAMLGDDVSTVLNLP
jgi:hypothetical protein